MTADKLYLSYPEAIKFLIALLDKDLYLEFEFKKNSLTVFNDQDQKQFKYNYPLILNLSESIIKDTHLLNICIRQKPSFFMMLIQAGSAALGVYDGDTLIDHKTIRKYMTRKKQGKSQLKYLKTKGKSRAGSRIRLANSVDFFEEINQYLNNNPLSEMKTIIYSCTPMLWGMLFQSKICPPFAKNDIRLKKLPLNIDVPNFDVLKKAAGFSQKGYIHLFADCQDDMHNVLFQILAAARSEKTA